MKGGREMKGGGLRGKNLPKFSNFRWKGSKASLMGAPKRGRGKIVSESIRNYWARKLGWGTRCKGKSMETTETRSKELKTEDYEKKELNKTLQRRGGDRLAIRKARRIQNSAKLLENLRDSS